MIAKPEERAAATRSDPRWEAVLARDPAADGQFYYSVRTTGVYCRPSCCARAALPENVQFHATAEAAERAGYRPCQRCRPNEPGPDRRQAARIASVCREIESAATTPTLAELARHSGLSPHHLHRVFKSVTGLTPRAYAAAHRAKRVRAELRQAPTVTDAVYRAGYGSSGRFYEAADGILGMTPSRYRAGGAGVEIQFSVGECSLGSVLVAATARGVCAIFFGDDPDALARELQDRFPRARLKAGDSKFQRTVAIVVGFVEAPRLGFSLPLDVRGTAFQARVWKALREIPAGKTASYDEIARRLGSPSSARAVARACATNPVAVAIPCHRVVRKGGGISGYFWGVERKQALLEREALPGPRAAKRS
jgi:AraC family transcriptional regulator of adaptative response/methylated-DNA-[protein]-cysteine methyltransferase